MDFDAFNAGIEPGGLRSKSDIRVMLCYLLAGTQAPVLEKDIITIMQKNGFANYYEVMDALSSLEEMGSITKADLDGIYYQANEKTEEISRRLHTILPLTLRERAIASSLDLLAQAKREKENKVEINELSDGYQVVCHVCDGEKDLMTFSLYVPNQAEAQLVKKNFLKDPNAVYQLFLSMITENQAMIYNLLEKK